MKQLHLSKNIILSNFKRLSRPYKLTHALTYKCNSKCKICSIWKIKPKGELTTNQIKKFYRNNTYFNWIDLTGGEIFLRKDLVEIIKTIIQTNKNLYLLHFPTNCLMPQYIEKQVKRILDYKPHRLIVTNSLDGPKEIHDHLRGIEGNFDRVIDTYSRLSKFKSTKFEVYLGMTLSKHNFRYIDKMYSQVKKAIPHITPNDIHFNLAHNSSHYYGNQNLDLSINQQIITSMNRFLSKRKQKLTGVDLIERRYQSLIPQYIKTGKSPIPCKALSSSLFIDPWGKIFPCTMWAKQLTSLEKVEYKLSKMWNDPNTLAVQKQAYSLNCPNCWTPCEAYQTVLGNLVS